MSEMKPVAWMRGELLSFYEPINGRPLYTADQLAEVVAAERERHLQFLEEIKKMQTSIKEHIEAIRSAAK